MELKVDNNYYCKKSLYRHDISIFFKKGQYYMISFLHHREVVVSIDNDSKIFSVDKNTKYEYFFDYFSTKNEERKYKLEKILCI